MVHAVLKVMPNSMNDWQQQSSNTHVCKIGAGKEDKDEERQVIRTGRSPEHASTAAKNSSTIAGSRQTQTIMMGPLWGVYIYI